MTDGERNLIEIGDYFIIYSSITKKPYITEDRECYVTEMMKEADAYAEKFGNCYRSEKPEKLVRGLYCNKFYSYGIKTIILKKANKDEIRINITKEDVEPKQYLNEDVNADILRLMETKKKKYLRSLRDEDLFCPISINIRLKGQYPKIAYCNAHKHGEMYLPLFTTIQEFEKWNSKQGNKWKPFKTSLEKIDPHRKKNSVIVNPETEKLILYGNIIKDVLKEKKN